MDLGLRNRAKFFRENSLRVKARLIKEALNKGEYKLERAADIKDSVLSNKMSLEDSLLKKEYDLKNLFEISKEIYQTLNPKELIDILLLTFMGYTRAKAASFFVKKFNEIFLFLNKDFSENDIKFVKSQIEKEQTLNDKNFYVFELKGKTIIGYLVLKDLGLEDIEDKIQVLLPIISLGCNALENAFLHDNLKKKFKQLEAIYSIGEILKSSPKLEEIIFLTFSTMEYGLGIKKMLLINKQDGLYKVFDGYGFREYTYQKLSFSEESAIFKLLKDKKYLDVLKEKEVVNEYFSPYDVEEMNVTIFIPLKVYDKVLGFFVIGGIEDIGDYDWKIELYQVLSSYFASALYTLYIAPLEDKYSNVSNISVVLKNIISEQILMAKNFNYKIFLAFVKIKDELKISEFKPIVITILGKYKLLSYTFQSDAEFTKFVEVLKYGSEIISTSLVIDGKSVDNVIYELELIN